LTDRASHHPSQLSGGQQQRVALARALVNEPEVILADEPTGNLDSRTSIEIMGVFQALNAAGITIVMVTHELDIASFCKRIIIMRDGEILSDEPNSKQHLATDELALLNQRERRVKLA
jgi:putative ABC transport system ATP-binding protein